MPLLAFSFMLIVGALGIGIDLMRDVETAQQLEFAAQQAALYGVTFAVDQNGQFTNWNASAPAITNAIVSQSARFGWPAQFGPVGKVWSKPVTFAGNDVALRVNPQDATESFVDVTADRSGTDSLRQFFWPIFLTRLPASSQAQNSITVSSHQLAEVFSQPATRVGAGAPAGTASLRSTELAGFAVLPIAISNAQYASLVARSKVGAAVTIDLSTAASAAGPNHLKGGFVNLSATGSTGGAYYGSAQGDLAISQLESLLQYFSKNTQTNLAPAAVERGSQLSAFNPADPAFVRHQNEIRSAVIALPPLRNYILPVLAADPSFAGVNIVVGFARLQITGFSTSGQQVTQAICTLSDSVPLRNVSSATGMSTIAPNLGNQMQAPVAPFLPRAYRVSDNSLAPRTPGIVLAAALSPYKNPPLTQSPSF